MVHDGISFNKKDILHNLTLFLYPDDSDDDGRKLRIFQQYFMVSNAAQFILDEATKKGCNLHDLADYAVIQINDTHPSMVIPELIRLLTERGIDFDEAAEIVSKVCAYTNHTILAEALEKWPMDYLLDVVPHLVPIIEKLDEKIKAKYPQENVAIIDKNNLVHMAHMDIHYGFSINGVAALHTEILKKQEQIRKKKAERQQVKAAKENLLKEREGEKVKLEAQEKEKRILVANLQKKQRGLQNEINKKRREANQLNARIDKLIAEEIERARKRAQEEARREEAARRKAQGKEGQSAGTGAKTKSKPLEVYTMSKADRELSGNFAANRGKLPMPISGAYIITSHYGQYAVEGLRNVKLDNKGIDIQGKPGAQARAIFDGKVAAVFQLNGLFNVLIRHGNYISVYCNLSSASVKSGDTVKTKQHIGEVFSDGTDNGRTVLHFQLRREKEKLNPEPWLNR